MGVYGDYVNQQTEFACYGPGSCQYLCSSSALSAHLGNNVGFVHLFLR